MQVAHFDHLTMPDDISQIVLEHQAIAPFDQGRQQLESPVHVNPHFAGALEELLATRIFYEPLAGWYSDGNLAPMLATEVPSLANGGVSADGRQVIWKLKRGVTWHDGKPFTADDAVFSRRYAGNPATSTVRVAPCQDIVVNKLDVDTVRVSFPKPTPFWADMQVWTVAMNQPEPQLFREQQTSWQVSQKANKWACRSRNCWRSPEYDTLHKAAQVELDPVKRAALFIRMNDLVITSGCVIRIVSPKGVKATANKLNVTFASWDTDCWVLGSGSRDT